MPPAFTWREFFTVESLDLDNARNPSDMPPHPVLHPPPTPETSGTPCLPPSLHITLSAAQALCFFWWAILFFHLFCSMTFVLAAEHVQDNFQILPGTDSCGPNYTKAVALGGLGWCRVCMCKQGSRHPQGGR